MPTFSETDHPRGQPENAGEFAPKAGASTKAPSEPQERTGQPATKDTAEAPNVEHRLKAQPGEPITWPGDPPDETVMEASAWMRAVQPEQLEAMRAYTDYATSQRVNPQLRDCPDPPYPCLDDEAKAMNDTVTAVIRAAGRRQPPVTTFRGCDKRFAGIQLEKARECLQSGKPMQFAGITSLSLSCAKAVEYSKVEGGIVFQVTAHTGAYVEPITQAPGEYELVHPHGRMYAVQEVVEGQQIQGPDGQMQSMTVIRMTELVDDFS